MTYPQPGSFELGLKFCHWNLNGILARNRIKFPLMEAYSTVFHFEIIALSESFLNNTVKNEDIFIEGFSKIIFRSEHPEGDKVGVVCIYLSKICQLKEKKT